MGWKKVLINVDPAAAFTYPYTVRETTIETFFPGQAGTLLERVCTTLPKCQYKNYFLMFRAKAEPIFLTPSFVGAVAY